MDGNKRGELVVLAIGWFVAVIFQYLLSDATASYISQHWISDAAIANSGNWGAFLTMLRNKFFYSGCIGVLLYFWIYSTNQFRIEFECAFFVTLIIGAFLSFWPYLTKTGQTDWDVPIFFVTCTPACGGIWKLLYMWLCDKAREANKTNDLKGDVKAEIEPKAAIQAVVTEPKPETKPIAQVPQPPQKPPAKPVKRVGWRTKL